MKYFIIGLVYLSLFLIFRFIWIISFTPRKKENTKYAKDIIKQNKKISSRQLATYRYKLWSQRLNMLPFFQLTPEKRALFETNISAQCSAYSLVKPTPEELHVQQWVAVVICFILSTISIPLIDHVAPGKGWIGMIMYITIPYAYRLPTEKYIVKEEKGQTEIVEEHFLDFYKTYYTAYKGASGALDLRATITAYAGTCKPEMRLFCLLFEKDIQSTGSSHAIQLLQTRYPKSSRIRKFCSLALAIDREDAGAETEADGFLQLLLQEDYIKQKEILDKNSERMKSIINMTLLVLLTALVLIQVLSMLKQAF